MGDVGCVVCDKVLAKNIFMFKCKICKREFEDVPGILNHFLDRGSFEKLSCQALEPIVKIKEEAEPYNAENNEDKSSTGDSTDIKEAKNSASSSSGLSDPVAIAKLEEIKAILERDWYAQLEDGWEMSEPEVSSTSDDEAWEYEDDDRKLNKPKVGPDGKIKCNLCGTMVKKSNMKIHKARKHGQGKLYECEHCDYTTFYGSHLPIHLKRKHDIDSEIVKLCLVCGYECFSNSQMQSHISKSHGDEELERWNNYDWSKHDPDSHVFAESKPKKNEQKASTCADCGEDFPSWRAMRKHQKSQVEECEQCGISVPHGKMSGHMLTKHSNPQCSTCQKTFDSVRVYKDHMKTYHFVDDNKPNVEPQQQPTMKPEEYNSLKCYTCQNPFQNSIEFENHCSTRESCKYCLQAIAHDRVHEHMVSLHKAELKLGNTPIQITLEAEKASYHCCLCPTKFPRMKAFKRHFWMEHDASAFFTVEEGENFQKERFFREQSQDEKVICDICGVHVKKRDVKTHKARKHGLGKVYQCELCGFSTHYGHSMPLHMKRKHGVGDNADLKLCLVCGFECFTNAEIKSHIFKIHGQEELERWNNYDWSKHDPSKHVFTMPKPAKVERLPRMAVYKCDICGGKVFKNRKLWRSHMKIFHLDKTEYSCPFCDLTTKFKGHLRKHLDKKHSAQQQLVYKEQCHMCRKAFETQKGLIVHLNGAHGITMRGGEIMKATPRTGGPQMPQDSQQQQQPPQHHPSQQPQPQLHLQADPQLSQQPPSHHDVMMKLPHEATLTHDARAAALTHDARAALTHDAMMKAAAHHEAMMKAAAHTHGVM